MFSFVGYQKRLRSSIICGLQINPGILLVVPLHLAITPTRVLQDPLFGPECKAMLEEGEVDDRFLMMLFLTVERLRKNSSWNPYVKHRFNTLFGRNFLDKLLTVMTIFPVILICFQPRLGIHFGSLMMSF